MIAMCLLLHWCATVHTQERTQVPLHKSRKNVLLLLANLLLDSARRQACIAFPHASPTLNHRAVHSKSPSAQTWSCQQSLMTSVFHIMDVFQIINASKPAIPITFFYIFEKDWKDLRSSSRKYFMVLMQKVMSIFEMC